MHTHMLPEKELHVICVDDDTDFLNSMSLVLPDKLNAMVGDECALVFSFFPGPEEALEMLAEVRKLNEDVAMIISDQKMPVMKGTEFLAKSKEFAPDAARVLLTGYAGIDSAVDAINDKLLDKYVTKPIEDEQGFIISLSQMLRKYLMGLTISNQSKALNDLYQFSNTLNSIEDYDQALNYIVEFTTHALKCDRVSIMLLANTPQPCLKIAAARGIAEDIIKDTRLPVGEGIAGGVFETREAVYAHNIAELGYDLKQGNRAEAYFMSVPMLWANLKSGENPVGVINATSKKGDSNFSQSDLELLTYISNTASIAINNHINNRKLKESYIETKTQAATMRHMMLHDPVTNLPNRASLDKNLRQLMSNAGSAEQVTVLQFNLMRFREINCTLGHTSGDILLREIGQTLHENISESWSLFHLGSDEFAIILADGSIREAENLALQIQGLFSDPIEIDGIKIDTAFNYGIARYPSDAKDHNLLMQRADVAVSQAKETGNKIAVYSADNDQYNTRLLSMMNELGAAIEADELVLYYQPKLCLTSGKVKGAEALIRWIHPEHGFVPPNHFIPLAEQMGLMEPLTEWVIRQAVGQCARWNADGVGEGQLNIAINLSTLNLEEEGFARKVLEICNADGIETSQLSLEVTESVLMGNLEKSLATLNELSEMGFQIDLDDFGTGYSSLAYVKNLPIDSIKIDRSFVMDIGTGTQDLQIVHSIIELGHSLQLGIIAEGVENEAAESLLADLGCDVVQGFYYSRPLAADDFEDWVARRSDTFMQAANV